jgi:hypothetical protein
MKKPSPFPLHDYSPALQGALSWLGDRHLFARPTARLRAEPAPYFAQPRRWHPEVDPGFTVVSSSSAPSDVASSINFRRR